jgi:hypothetical protein
LNKKGHVSSIFKESALKRLDCTVYVWSRVTLTPQFYIRLAREYDLEGVQENIKVTG